MSKRMCCLLVAMVCWSAPARGAGDAEVLLQFPTDRAVGQVQSRPKSLGGFGFDENWYEGWKSLGTAQGEVKVPADHFVQLNVSKAASQELSFLQRLDPSAIDVLILRGTDVTDDALQALSGMTGLKFLDLEQTKITDACAPHFANLTSLVRVDLAAFDVNREGFGVGDKVLGVLGTLPHLSSIELRLTKVTDTGMAELAKCQSLESVAVEGTEVTDTGLAHLAKLNNLKSLSLGVYDEGAKVTDEGMKLVARLPKLRWLRLSGTAITDQGLEYLSSATQLESLDFEGTQVTGAGIAHLEPLQKLEALNVSDDIDDEAAKHLSKLRNLKRVSSNLEVSDEGVAYLTTLPRLEELMLTDEKVTDASLPAIAKMPKLKTLWFQRCQVTDEGMAELKGHPTLEYVLFRELPITSASFDTFAALPKLKILNLAWNYKPSVQPDWAGLRKLTRLEHLSIEADAFKAGDTVHLRDLKQLKWLELQPREPLDDDAIANLADLENLENLDLRSTNITDKGMSALKNKPKLEYMTISCQTTDDGLAALHDSKSLRYLQIASPYVTEKGLKALEAALPSLQEINRFNYRLSGMEVSAVTKDEYLRKGSIDTRPAKDKLEDMPAPMLSVATWFNRDGSELQIADMRGKVVVVFFWNAAETRSIDKLTALKKLQDDWKDLGLEIVAIHSSEGSEAAEMYVSPLLMPWPVGIDDKDTTKAAWAVDSYPSFYLVDRTGQVCFADVFPDQLEKTVKHLLDEPAK